jgi:hypothetical protein
MLPNAGSAEMEQQKNNHAYNRLVCRKQED